MKNQHIFSSITEKQGPSHLQFIGIAIIAGCLWLVAFWGAITSAVYLWYTDTTFNHCFFVIPASLYFGYKVLPSLNRFPVTTDLLALTALAGLIVLWAVGYAASIQLFVHFAAFLFPSILIWIVVGRRNAAKLWFPLTFVVFAVPFGSELIAPFQEITADFAVFMLKAVDIPVFRSGLYIDVPNGKFEVAEACSGVRFFIASVCFGYFYAYISYRSLTKRVLFVIVSTLFPILANGIRVFGTILVGEKIGMEYAASADHLVYGWVFFAVVLLILIWLGNFWADPPGVAPQQQDGERAGFAVPVWIVLPIGLVLGWKVLIDNADEVNGELLDKHLLQLQYPVVSLPAWKPEFYGEDTSMFGKDPQTGIQVYVAAYRSDDDHSEAISFNNRFYHPDIWTKDSQSVVRLDTANGEIDASVIDLRAPSGEHRAILYWYKMPGYEGASAVQVKLRQALSKLIGRQLPTAVIMLSDVYSPYGETRYGSFMAKTESLVERIDNVTLRFD